MSTKSELKEKLFELKKQIKLNSKDAHWAENALQELESIIGKLKHETVELEVGKKVDEWSGKTFRITKTTHGVLFHTYGGYNVFCTPNNNALYQTLVDYVERQREFSTLTDEQKQNHELVLKAVAQCVCLPQFVFADGEFMFNIATSIVKYINDLTTESMSELKDETVQDRELFEAFKDVQIGTTELVEQIGKEIKELKENS